MLKPKGLPLEAFRARDPLKAGGACVKIKGGLLLGHAPGRPWKKSASLQRCTMPSIPQHFCNPEDYLHLQHTFRCYHEAFQNLPSDVKVLDYGAGPVVISTISAATKASQIE